MHYEGMDIGTIFNQFLKQKQVNPKWFELDIDRQGSFRQEVTLKNVMNGSFVTRPANLGLDESAWIQFFEDIWLMYKRVDQCSELEDEFIRRYELYRD